MELAPGPQMKCRAALATHWAATFTDGPTVPDAKAELVDYLIPFPIPAPPTRCRLQNATRKARGQRTWLRWSTVCSLARRWISGSGALVADPDVAYKWLAHGLHVNILMFFLP